MAYKDRYGSTELRNTKLDNFSIGWDNMVDKNVENLRNRIPVFLFTPNMDDTNDHHHIMLTRHQARKLRDWLDDYLRDTQKTQNKPRNKSLAKV